MTAIAVIVLEIEAMRKTGVRIDRRARLDVGDAVPVKPRQRSIADHPDRQAGGRPAVQDLVDPGPHLVTSDRRDAHRAPPSHRRLARAINGLQPLDFATNLRRRHGPADVPPDRPDGPPEVRPQGVDHEDDEPDARDEEEPRIHVPARWGSDAIRLGHVCSS